jgi:hypothetical protein
LDIFHDDEYIDWILVQETFELKLLPIIEWILFFELIDSHPWEFIKNSFMEENEYQEIYKRIEIKVRFEHLKEQTTVNLKLVKMRCFFAIIFSKRKEYSFFEFLFESPVRDKFYSNNSILNSQSTNKSSMKIKRKLKFILKNENVNFENIEIDPKFYIE